MTLGSNSECHCAFSGDTPIIPINFWLTPIQFRIIIDFLHASFSHTKTAAFNQSKHAITAIEVDAACKHAITREIRKKDRRQILRFENHCAATAAAPNDNWSEESAEQRQQNILNSLHVHMWSRKSSYLRPGSGWTGNEPSFQLSICFVCSSSSPFNTWRQK